MSKEKIFETIICILAIVALILALTTNVFATGSGTDLLGSSSNKNNASATDDDDDDDDETNKNTNSNRNSNTNSNRNTNTNSNKNTNTNSNSNSNSNKNVSTMPNTGVDYSVITIIGVCGVSALYAYKKIRDYKNV